MKGHKTGSILEVSIDRPSNWFDRPVNLKLLESNGGTIDIFSGFPKQKRTPRFEIEPPMIMIMRDHILKKKSSSTSSERDDKKPKTTVTSPTKTIMKMKKKKVASNNLGKKKATQKTIRQIKEGELPQWYKNKIMEMGGYNVRPLIEKTLTRTDLSRDHNRLALPANQIQYKNFLSQAENDTLSLKEGTKNVGIQVVLIDPGLREHEMELKIWSMKRTQTYNVVKRWHEISTEYNLHENQLIQVWSFRVRRGEGIDPKLGLALVRVGEEEQGITGSGSGAGNDSSVTEAVDHGDKPSSSGSN